MFRRVDCAVSLEEIKSRLRYTRPHEGCILSHGHPLGTIPTGLMLSERILVQVNLVCARVISRALILKMLISDSVVRRHNK